MYSEGVLLMDYDTLLVETDNIGLIAKEKPLHYNNGRIKGNRIAIRQDIPTQTEKSCVLAEELGHYYTNYGDVLDQSDVQNRKQEFRARMWGYNFQIGLLGIVKAFEHGCQNRFETAEYLDVTEDYLDDAITAYRGKYGRCTAIDNYIIYFDPSLMVMKMY